MLNDCNRVAYIICKRMANKKKPQKTKPSTKFNTENGVSTEQKFTLENPFSFPANGFFLGNLNISAGNAKCGCLIATKSQIFKQTD